MTSEAAVALAAPGTDCGLAQSIGVQSHIYVYGFAPAGASMGTFGCGITMGGLGVVCETTQTNGAVAGNPIGGYVKTWKVTMNPSAGVVVEEGARPSQTGEGRVSSSSWKGSCCTFGAIQEKPLVVQLVVQERLCGMKTMTYSESRARYAEVMDSVINDREEVVITRVGHDPVVMLSLEDYESLKEAAYLMRSPRNARRISDSIARLKAGLGEKHQLIEE